MWNTGLPLWNDDHASIICVNWSIRFGSMNASIRLLFFCLACLKVFLLACQRKWLIMLIPWKDFCYSERRDCEDIFVSLIYTFHEVSVRFLEKNTEKHLKIISCDVILFFFTTSSFFFSILFSRDPSLSIPIASMSSSSSSSIPVFQSLIHVMRTIGFFFDRLLFLF